MVSHAFEPLELSRAASFACIAMLESGYINVGAEGLETVIALSSGDSLFVTMPLICDPAYQVLDRVIRIRGNIGRAGIAMMIPPSQSAQEQENDNWRLVTHARFDGKIKDSFPSTSLHLSFTDFQLAIDTGNRGIRSTELVLLETVISVHDKGQWIADLDVSACFKSKLFRPIKENVMCSHTSLEKNAPTSEIISVDSWSEFLNQPTDAIVLRAHRNWEARLAASVLSVAHSNLTVVFGNQPCWACGEAERERFRHKKVVYIV